MLTVFWDMKRPITIDFCGKDATLNRATNSQILKQILPNLFYEQCTHTSTDPHTHTCINLGIFVIFVCS